ncbi:GNAT family N-acetyltransferase [Paenibacillus tianjinensis]|uniref:GNAT family N-acetyltransferase n=1 Tax=Paenibacillus tianjinensis TaxID=2810347 RepID=A0ABX7LHM7_9BACL|nr:GNAT family N-acetyltransferase [Paenibacillus tianjinensis]QSF46976.1 GNAT family N-acetyltransferase [Paenibacillus tianjinensis]
MERSEIYKHINDSANYYLRLLGEAEHMEFTDNGYYAMTRPKSGDKCGTSVFNIRLEQLTDVELKQKVEEIKALDLHTWWGFNLSERMAEAIWPDHTEAESLPEPNDEEACLAVLPEQWPAFRETEESITVTRVADASDFKIWADLNNRIMHGGYPVMHPDNHYHLCESGIIDCYIANYNGVPAAVCSIMNNGDISSLEFVATSEEYRRQGLAAEVCIEAINSAFSQGAQIISTRGFGHSKKLFKKLGFTVY